MSRHDDGKAEWVESLEFYNLSSVGERFHDWRFKIFCNEKNLVVTVSPGSLQEDLTTSLINRYSKAYEEEDDNLIQDVEDEILDLILDVGWKQFREVAPSSPKAPVRLSRKSLHSDLNPEVFHFHLTTKNGHPNLLPKAPPPPLSHSVELRLEENTMKLPHYLSKDIVFEKKLMSSGYIAKVAVEGVDMCCKIGTASSYKAVQREYDCISRIMSSKDAVSIPVPKLLGLVVDDKGIILGILEEFIVNRGRLSDVVRDQAEICEERKEKWIAQIGKAVEGLHSINVVWGDGKAENVLVDGEDNCFLVDFGGSWTEGWVDEGLRETREGDRMAVEKIERFLRDGIVPGGR